MILGSTGIEKTQATDGKYGKFVQFQFPKGEKPKIQKSERGLTVLTKLDRF
jgi:hypothetical protein